jgi:rubrerythrin
MFSAAEVYAIAVRIEENGEKFYRKALEASPDGLLKNLLNWIAEEEVRHRDYFLKMMASTKGKRDEPWAEQLSRALLNGAVDTHAFTLDEIDVESLRNEMDVINSALILEEDSIAFYELLSAFITEPGIQMRLSEIISEERKHVVKLEERQRILAAFE